jgi:hypothetical protein
MWIRVEIPELTPSYSKFIIWTELLFLNWLEQIRRAGNDCERRKTKTATKELLSPNWLE